MVSARKIDRLFREHQHLIEKAVYSQQIQINGVTAEDVYQEVSIRIINLIKSDREIENLASYIYRTTANVIVDLARKHQRHQQEVMMPGQEQEDDQYQADLASNDASPDRLLNNQSIQQQLLAAIESLPESRRVAVKMRLQGYSVKEMAELTGWAYYKAENLSKRGMAALKEKLSAMDIDYEID